MDKQINVSKSGNICTIELDNPASRNALTPAMLSTLRDTITSLRESDDFWIVIFKGSGDRAFCSGYDLESLVNEDSPLDGQKRHNDVMELIQIYEAPTIAMINGDAIGGGFDLAAACDMRLAADSARFGIPPAKIGLIYADRGIQRFIQTIGSTNTKELLFTADLVDAERAKEMGLLNYVMARDELEERAYLMAEKMANNVPFSLKGMKKIILNFEDKQRFTEDEQQWVTQLQEKSIDNAASEAAMSNIEERFQSTGS